MSEVPLLARVKAQAPQPLAPTARPLTTGAAAAAAPAEGMAASYEVKGLRRPARQPAARLVAEIKICFPCHTWAPWLWPWRRRELMGRKGAAMHPQPAVFRLEAEIKICFPCHAWAPWLWP